MAIDTLRERDPLTDRLDLCGRDLERIARASIAGQPQVAMAVVESAAGLLECDMAVLLRPTGHPTKLAVTHATRGGDGPAHERWDLGARTPRLLDRPSHTADGWREPWSALRVKLSGLGARAWAAAPLCNEGRGRPLGLLVVGRRRGNRPCGQMHRLTDLALSATAALAAAPPDDESASGEAFPGGGHERVQTVSTLAFGVSHTLGNIFGAILGNLQFLQEEASSEDARDLIERIERATAQGVELMRSLQAYTAMPASIGMRPVDLSDIVAEVAALVRRMCGHWPERRGVQIETDLSDAAPVWGDPRQVREALVNVVFNALQAVGPEGRVALRTGCDGRLSEVRVVDDGPGMGDDVRRRATEPFFTTRPTLHQGLGLTVARGIAVGHRGSLTLHRAPGGGTEVALRLPQDPPADRRCEMAIGAALSAAAGHRKEH